MKLTNRNYWIITMTLVIVVSVLTAWLYNPAEHHHPKPPSDVPVIVQPAPPAMTIAASLLPHGGWGHCWYHWYVAFYRDCTILAQPGDTADLNAWFKEGGASSATSIGIAFGAFCAKVFGGLGSLSTVIAIVCGAIGTIWGARIVYFTKVAAGWKQCLRIRWSEIPYPGGPPQRFKIDNYGEWQRWINVGDRRFWALPTPCKMYRDCLTYGGGITNGCVI